MISISKPLLGEEEKQAVAEVIESGILAQGPRVKAFEERFSDYIGAKHAVAVSSGTSALYLALQSVGIKPGDEVITSPFTFIATGTSILFCGGRPVFADIEPGTYNIDPEAIESAITRHTKAILPVHLYGQPARMNEIMEIAQAHDLLVIEDVAQAVGADYNGKKPGTIGDVGCFSFYATKNMTTGEGGMITTDNDSIADDLRLLRSHGQVGRYEFKKLGNNLRMTDIEAAIGLCQLMKLPSFNDARIKNAAYFNEHLKTVKTPQVDSGVTHVYHQYTIRHDNRDMLKDWLEKNGIGSGIYYPAPLTRCTPLKEFASGPVSEAEKASREVLSLPVHPGLHAEDLETIVKAVNEFKN